MKTEKTLPFVVLRCSTTLWLVNPLWDGRIFRIGGGDRQPKPWWRNLPRQASAAISVTHVVTQALPSLPSPSACRGRHSKKETLFRDAPMWLERRILLQRAFMAPRLLTSPILCLGICPPAALCTSPTSNTACSSQGFIFWIFCIGVQYFCERHAHPLCQRHVCGTLERAQRLRVGEGGG